MARKKIRFPTAKILVGILFLAGIGILLFFSYRYLTTASYFEVKDSTYFSGQNIFKVNLKKQAESLRRKYPDYKNIVLRRMLPDRIVINFKPRQAVALLRLTEDFCVDDEGVLFLPSRQSQDTAQLPLIAGLQERIPYPRSGTKYSERSLQAILEFIDNLNEDQILSESIKINKIDLSNINDVILFTTAGYKINLGSIWMLAKDFSILQKLISKIKPDLSKIEYIDLRFKEPVVKYK